MNPFRKRARAERRIVRPCPGEMLLPSPVASSPC
jgi:hypothetical protein